MRIEQLIAFDKVVQHSSFTKAANELYTTQPSVSKMIDALEDELGHQLLRRTSRGIELTAYGKWVYGDVKIILQMVNGRNPPLWRRFPGRYTYRAPPPCAIFSPRGLSPA